MTTDDTIECRYHGRDFTTGEMALMRALIASSPQQTRAGLARAFCRAIGWVKPDGGLKAMMARLTMLKMHRDGIITLPPPQRVRSPPRPPSFGPETEPPASPPLTLEAARPLRLVKVTGAGRRASRLWNEFIARYHYLGYKTLVGAQMRYAVHDRDGRPLAMLGFSAAAWKVAPRDDFIGWRPETRERNLPLMVDNSRYLIMPWIRIPNLASHILSTCAPSAAAGLVHPVQGDTGPDGNLRRNPALLRDHLQGFRMDPCRNHPGTREVRHKEGIRKTEKGRLALSAQKRLETNAQSMTAGKAITPLPNAYSGPMLG